MGRKRTTTLPTTNTCTCGTRTIGQVSLLMLSAAANIITHNSPRRKKRPRKMLDSVCSTTVPASRISTSRVVRVREEEGSSESRQAPRIGVLVITSSTCRPVSVSIHAIAGSTEQGPGTTATSITTSSSSSI